MRLNLSKRESWNYVSTVNVTKKLSYNFYKVFEKKTLSLYAEAYNNSELLYDADLQDFVLDVYSVVVEKVVNGVSVDAREYFTGRMRHTADTAISALMKNVLDFKDNIARIENVLEAVSLPKIDGIDYITRSFVKNRMGIAKPTIKKYFRDKSFKISINTDNELLHDMFKGIEYDPVVDLIDRE